MTKLESFHPKKNFLEAAKSVKTQEWRCDHLSGSIRYNIANLHDSTASVSKISIFLKALPTAAK